MVVIFLLLFYVLKLSLLYLAFYRQVVLIVLSWRMQTEMISSSWVSKNSKKGKPSRRKHLNVEELKEFETQVACYGGKKPDVLQVNGK